MEAKHGMGPNPIQKDLVGQSFVDQSLTESIRFNEVVLDGNVGKLYDSKGTYFGYTLDFHDGYVTIDCFYFGGIFKISTTPTGFALYNGANILEKEYINTFCIENQKLFVRVLEFLCNGGEDGHLYTAVELVPKVINSTKPGQTFQEIVATLEVVMDILVKMNSVSPGMKQGEAAIGFNLKTQKHLTQNVYRWEQKQKS